MISSFAQTITPTPEVAWSGLMPLLILAGSAVVLLTIMSVAKTALPRWFSPIYTMLAGVATIVSAIPLWQRVHDRLITGRLDSFSTLKSAYGVDGFSVFFTMLLAVSAFIGYPYACPRYYVVIIGVNILTHIIALLGLTLATAHPLARSS